jgi:hypothetical protein
MHQPSPAWLGSSEYSSGQSVCLTTLTGHLNGFVQNSNYHSLEARKKSGLALSI